MNLTDFETKFGQFGLRLADYQQAAYYGACEQCSLTLQPFPAAQVKRAKLAVRAGGRDRSTIIERFFAAAEVQIDASTSAALAAGRDFRTRVGLKEVSFTAIGSDLVVNVAE